MADHNKPTLSSNYSDFVSELDARFDDLAVGLDPAVTTASNLPSNAIRWTSASNKWQKWNGSTWGDLTSTYAINISGSAGSVAWSNVVSKPSDLVYADGGTYSLNISGSAASLTTARTINSVSFNGTANIDINLNTALTFNNSGSGAASGTTFNGSTARTISYNTVGAPKADGTGASGSWSIDITGSSASCTGNASTASTLQNTRTINGVNFNGSANIDVEPYVERDDSTNANRYITFVDSSTAGNQRLNMDNALTYNPSTNTLTCNLEGTTSNAIGNSQTWQIVTRTNGASYTNNTGKPIMVNAYDNISGNLTGYQELRITVDSVVVAFNRMYLNEENGSCFVSAIVPSGSSYTISMTGSYNSLRVVELR